MAQRKVSLAVWSLVTGVAMLATACSGAGGGAKDGGGSDAANGKGKQADAAYKQRQCMRDHGIDVQEPKPGQDPRGIAIGGKNTSQEKMEKALKECGNDGKGGKREISQADKDKALKFAQCMRKNGFDMPDPKFDGGMQKALQVPEGPQKEKFDKANKACGGDHAG